MPTTTPITVFLVPFDMPDEPLSLPDWLLGTGVTPVCVSTVLLPLLSVLVVVLVKVVKGTLLLVDVCSWVGVGVVGEPGSVADSEEEVEGALEVVEEEVTGTELLDEEDSEVVDDDEMGWLLEELSVGVGVAPGGTGTDVGVFAPVSPALGDSPAS